MTRSVALATPRRVLRGLRDADAAAERASRSFGTVSRDPVRRRYRARA